MVVLDALATLPPRTRVVVMRYWADIWVGGSFLAGMVITPDATNKAGTPIKIRVAPVAMVIVAGTREALGRLRCRGGG